VSKLTSIRLIVIAGLVGAGLQTGVSFAADNDADFEFYKTRVEPIFLKHRPPHGRCVTCHAGGGTAMRLEPLAPGATTWTEEQSRRNYEVVSQLASSLEPNSGPLLLHPLAPEAGGDLYHSGGHQFASRDDPDWQTIAEWVRQRPKPEYKNLKVLQSGDHLMDTMRFFELSLRQDCTHCHVPGDFASDKNPRKVMARNMMQMVATLSQTVGKNRVTCYTCHRGDTMPMTVHPSFPELQHE
jgi:hypothetical protein